MKKLLMFSLLLFSAICTYADSRLFFDDNLSIKPGETKTIELKLQNTERIKGLQFKLTFPEYITVLEDEEEEEYIVGTDRCGILGASVSSNATVVNVAGVAGKKKDYIPVSEGDDTGIITLIIEASNSAPVGIGKIAISDIEIVEETSGTLNPENSEFDISVVKECSVSVSTSDQTKGTVTGEGGVYDSGTQVTVSATPATGYKFVNWTSGETAVSTDNPYVFTVTDDINLVANFAPNQYTMTFVLDNNEDNVVKTQDYNSTLEAPTPTKNGYTFKGWNPEVPATVPAENMTFTAQWEANSSAQVTIDTDLTSQFNSLATTQWTGSSGQVGWAAPQVTTNSGLTVAAWERYNGSCDWTGDIMYTTVTGLVPGTYKIELYGAAAFTFGRGFGSTAFTGDFSKDTSDTYAENESINENTGVTLYATTSEGTVSDEIPIYYATNFNASGIATVTLNNVVVGSDGEIKIGLSKTSTSTNWHVVQLKGVTATVDAVSTFATFKSEANALYESPMNATVLSELQAAANVDLSSAGADEYKTAIETLQAKITDANTSIANYAEAKAILDAANIYDAAGLASYAADETIAAIQAAYDDGSLIVVTNEQKAAAQAALATACKAQTQPADGCDMTPCIINPSFESEFIGWSYNMAIQNNTSFAKDGNLYVERWQPNGIFGISQTINVPAGVYRLSAKCLARGVISAKIYGGSEETSITIEDASNTYSVDFNCADKATIGFEGEGDGAGSSWLCVDNFQLTYVRQLTAEEIEVIAKENAKAAYDEALAAAQAFEEGTIPSTTYSDLQTVITNNTLEDGTSSEYNTAATALNAAAIAAQLLVTPYAVYLDTKDAVVTMKDADTYIGADAKSILEGVITTTSSNVEEATDPSTITTQTENLLDAAKNFVKTVTIESDQCLDLTCLIKNPHFKYGEGGSGKVAADWTLESGWVTEHRLQTHNFEAWHAHFNLSQTITDLPKGTYKVTLQGFARHDNASVTDKTSLYCGPVSQIIKDIKSEYSTTSFYSSEQASMGDNNRDTKYQKDNVDVYQPNGMTGAYYWFREINPATHQLFYTSEVQTLIESDGDLKIGFKCEADEDWVIWDNFHLYYYGSAIAVNIDENDVSSVYEKDIENANITLKRTFSAGNWNTIALPFDLSDAETRAAFGDGVEVATYSETYTDDGFYDSKVTFNKADDASITANTPVLLMTSTDKTTFTFNGKTIKAGEAKVEGGANFDFVGTYAASTTIAEGDYFIRDNQLWQSKGETTIKGTRAYFKAKTEGDQVRIADFRIGESESTGIVSINNGVKSIDNAMFDLQGRKVVNVKKGLYIKNSKKVVVR